MNFRSKMTVWMILCIVLPGIGLHAQTAKERLAKLQSYRSQDKSGKPWISFEGNSGPGNGKHIVLISGDDEYRSEQTMPMLGKILAMHHGFKCTILFAVDPSTGFVKPDHQTNIPGMEVIDKADLLILGLRFRNLPDDQMKHFVDYVDAGKPIIGIRTSTHAFNYPDDSTSAYKHYHWKSQEWEGGFGQQVFGDTWVNHHGKHGRESCRGVIENGMGEHPILRGVDDVWGPSDVYEIARLPESANILMRGAVLKGMNPDDSPVEGKKNDPMMPIAWTKGFKSKSGVEAKIFCTTMGASTDFQSAGLRRMVVNAGFWCLDLEDKIPMEANVDYIGEYNPTPFGFGNFQTGLKPSDYDLKK